MAAGETVAKNTLFLTAGSVAQKALAFVYFTLLARHFIPPEDVGRYLYALSYAAMFSVIVDFGIQPVLIREIAKDKSRSREIIGNALGIKLVIAFATAVAMIAISRFSESDPVKIALISVAAITLVLDSVQLSFYAVLRGYEKLNFEAIGVLIGQIAVVAVGGVLLVAHQPLYMLMFAFVAGSLWNAAYSYFMAAKVTGEKGFRPLWNRSVWLEILKLSLPFAAAAIFVRIYSSADSVMLNRMAGNAIAAFYGVPFKFVFAFQFIPIALSAALYPSFARFASADKAKTSELFANAERYLMLIALPLVAGMFTLAEPLIVAFYRSQYRPSIAVMQVLCWCLIPAFLDYPVGALLNASHRQNAQTALFAAVTALNIVLNFLLIPELQGIGAAIAALAGNAVLFAGGLVYARRAIDVPWKKLALTFARTAFASLAMAVAVVALRERLPLYATVAFGVLIYVGALFVTREIGRRDVVRLRDLIVPAKPEALDPTA